VTEEVNSDCLTLCLSRRLAIVEGRNPQAAMIATARKIRSETKKARNYDVLGEIITATPQERDLAVLTAEKMFLAY
jgi:hypothetical protein